MFDKVHFKNILETALGERTKEEYSKESGVSRGYISKCINMKISNPPSPEILKRLAAKAHNDITYEDLMQAAGYISSVSNKSVANNKSNSTISIDKRLKQLRQEKNLLQKDIAKALNITTSAYGFYEQGKRIPDTTTIKKLAEFHNVSVDYLLGRTNIRNPYESIKNNDQESKTLGEIISEYRKQHNLSLKEFADKSGVSYEYLNNLKSGNTSRDIKLSEISKIAKVMNISEIKLLEKIGRINHNPEDNEIMEKCNNLVEEYIKNNKDKNENSIRYKGLYTTLLIRKLFEDGLIKDGKIADSAIELIKASLKTDSKLLNKYDK